MFKLMLKIKIVSMSCILILISSMGSVNAQQSPEFISVHGTACQAVSLAQATARDARWTNGGITNPNPLGTAATKSFFVVCPIVTTDDGTDLTFGSDVFVYLNYSDHNGEDQVFCTVRRFGLSSVLVKTVTAEDTKNAGFTGHSQLTLSEITVEADQTFRGDVDNHSLVCLLQPGVTLKGYVYDFD